MFLDVKGERLLIDVEQYFISIYGRILDTYPGVLEIKKGEWISPDISEFTISKNSKFGYFDWVQDFGICNALKDSETECIPKIEYDDIVNWIRAYHQRFEKINLSCPLLKARYDRLIMK